jgi:hypothetical protein
VEIIVGEPRVYLGLQEAYERLNYHITWDVFEQDNLPFDLLGLCLDHKRFHPCEGVFFSQDFEYYRLFITLGGSIQLVP